MNRNRFLKNRLKFISAIATGAMIMSSILPYPALAVDSDLYEVTSNGERETIVTYESAAYFAVTIPKQITLDGKTKSAGYSITVRGDIPSDAKVGVSPKDQIPGIEGVNFYMEEQAVTRKADVVATVVQEATEWASNEVTETGTAKNGSISAPDLTAGKWQGAFMFDINLIENSESHTHNYVDGVCTGCGEKDPNAEVHTHTYAENITKEATCKETGTKTLTCECGDTRTESIPMKEHNYVDGACAECGERDPDVEVHTHTYTENIIKEATCKETGEKTLTCECGDTRTESISTTEHSYEDSFCTTCGEADKAVFSQAGLYTVTGKQLATWAELTEDYGLNVSENVTTSTYKAASILQGANVNPNGSNFVLVVKDGVESIGDFAFYKCDKMKAIILPSSVKSIGTYAFNSTSLTSVTFSEGLETIKEYAFFGTPLTTITIPQSVTKIDNFAFSLCSKLKKAILPSGLKYGSTVFPAATNIAYYET